MQVSNEVRLRQVSKKVRLRQVSKAVRLWQISKEVRLKQFHSIFKTRVKHYKEEIISIEFSFRSVSFLLKTKMHICIG